MNTKNIDNSYKKQLPVIIAIIIFLLIVAIFLPKAASREKSTNKIKNELDIEIVESNDFPPNNMGKDATIQSSDVGGELGASNINNVLGSESEVFYQQSEMDKVLEDNGLEIDQ